MYFALRRPFEDCAPRRPKQVSRPSNQAHLAFDSLPPYKILFSSIGQLHLEELQRDPVRRRGALACADAARRLMCLAQKVKNLGCAVRFGRPTWGWPARSAAQAFEIHSGLWARCKKRNVRSLKKATRKGPGGVMRRAARWIFKI